MNSKTGLVDMLISGVDEVQDTRVQTPSSLDLLVISTTRVNKTVYVVSRYEDNIWQLMSPTSNVSKSRIRLDFNVLPIRFRGLLKQAIYRYITRGLEGQVIPKSTTVKRFFSLSRIFINYLDELNISEISEITTSVTSNYVVWCKSRSNKKVKRRTLSTSYLANLFSVVEGLYYLSQYGTDPIPEHPWPGKKANKLAGHVSSGQWGGKTLVIPDNIFCQLFNDSLALLNRGDEILDLRDKILEIDVKYKHLQMRSRMDYKKRTLIELGWGESLGKFWRIHDFLRTACYIILASTTGCRNHELANLEIGSHYRTEDNDGIIFHWIRGRSDKLGVGLHDWMIPAVGVRAVRLMERWSEPARSRLDNRIKELKQQNNNTQAIVIAQKHHRNIFLNSGYGKKYLPSTTSLESWGPLLKKFCKHHRISWAIASHQFRRKFAIYAAHSQFGDLRYLREHFAHWSMDMTLGYAIERSWEVKLDLDLYGEIKHEQNNIKKGIVDTWLSEDKLAGGYGQSFKNWQRDPASLAIFKDHAHMLSVIAESTAIRSNGHSWCTADDDRCVGNTLERTRCGGCNNAVIGSSHIKVYKGMYSNLRELLNNDDIGEGGRQRVERDLSRCKEVLTQLGIDPER